MNAHLDHAPQSKGNTKMPTDNDSGISMPSRVFVQAQLEMTAPGDSDEQEADAVADAVISKGKIARSVSKGHFGNGIELTSQMGAQLASLQGHGSQLYGDLKSRMESGFERDFSNVRIHTGSKAAELSSSIGARAFTYGNDIYFNQGQFQPGTAQGDRLIAHELTHTVQQSGKVSRDLFPMNGFGDDYAQTLTENNKKEKERDEKGEKDEIRNIRNKYKIPKYLRYIIEYLFEYYGHLTDITVADCYYHAVLEHSFFKRKHFSNNLKLFYGENNDSLSPLPPDGFFDDDLEKGVAKWHYQVIQDKINKSPKPSSNAGPLVTAQSQMRDVIYRNQIDPDMAPVIREIEAQYLQFRINDLTPYGAKHLDTSGVIKPGVWEAGLVFMLVTPFLAAGAISGAVIGGAGGLTMGNGFALAMGSQKAKVIVGVTKNGLSLAYSLLTASEEEKNNPDFMKDKIIDCCVNILLDALFDYYGADISTLKKTVAWEGIRSAFKTVWDMIKDGADWDDMASVLARALSTALSNSGIPAFAGIEVPVSFFSADMINSMLGLLVGDSKYKGTDKDDQSELTDYQQMQIGFLNYSMLLLSVNSNS